MSVTFDSVGSDGCLQSFVEVSETFTTGAKEISRISNPLHRYFIQPMVDEGSKRVVPITTMATTHLRKFLYNHIHNLADGVLKAINLQRMGSDINIETVTKVIKLFIAAHGPASEGWFPLGQAWSDPLFIYRKYLHSPIITAAQEFFEATSEKFLCENSVPAYIQWAEKMVKQEASFAESSLHPTTRDVLIGTCEGILIIKRLNVLRMEFRPLFESEQDDYLRPLYALLSRVPNGMDFLRDTFRNLVDFDDIRDMQRRYLMMIHIPPELETLRNVFQTHVEEEGYSAVAELLNEGGADVVNSPRIYVDKLLEVRQKSLDIVRNAFNSDASFFAALEKACCIFINNTDATGTPRSKSAEMLVRHLDSFLNRRNNQQTDDKEIGAALNRSIVLFKYLDDKDIFQTFYTIKLAKRLIFNASISEDYEVNVISKLQEICGAEYTNRMLRMMTEINLSNDLTNQFKDHMDRSFPGDGGPKFGVLVLGTNFWPLDTPTGGFNIPTVMLPTFERFTRFFQVKHSGRKLTWLWNYSSNELRTTFLDREYILTTSSYQTAVLLLFNDNDALSLEEIHTATGTDNELLTQVLGPLERSKILLQDGADIFKLNKNFRSKKIRINLNQPFKKSAPESEKVVQEVEKDRKYVIQANIVRLMKSNKTMTNQGLIHEVTSQVARWFTPKVPDIKRAIDLLLEKEYIKRTEDKKDSFDYIA